jgi:nucleoid DNA-binding protein
MVTTRSRTAPANRVKGPRSSGSDRAGKSAPRSEDAGSGETSDEIDKVSGVETIISLAGKSSLTPEKAHEVYENLVILFRDSLLNGRPVILRRIGTFIPYLKAGRRYIHPTTGAVRKTNERWRVKFVMSRVLKKAFAELSKRK